MGSQRVGHDWATLTLTRSLCFSLSSSIVLSFSSPVLQNPQSSPLCISFLPWDSREDHTTMWIGVSTNLLFQSQVDFCLTCYSSSPHVPPVHQWPPSPSSSWFRSRLRVKSKMVLIYLGLRFCEMGKQYVLGSSVSIMKGSWGINWKGKEWMSRSELNSCEENKRSWNEVELLWLMMGPRVCPCQGGIIEL